PLPHPPHSLSFFYLGLSLVLISRLVAFPEFSGTLRISTHWSKGRVCSTQDLKFLTRPGRTYSAMVPFWDEVMVAMLAARWWPVEWVTGGGVGGFRREIVPEMVCGEPLVWRGERKRISMP